MTLERRIEIERAIVKKICDDAIARGYTISLHDGDEFSVRRTRETGRLLDNMMATDEETLCVHQANEMCIGHIFLVYGNTSWDVISDYTDSEMINGLLVGANELAKAFQNEE